MQTFTGEQYLKIDVANSFGLDKKTWDERLAWFDSNEPTLINNLKEAEKPAMFYAGVQAWRAYQSGEPIGYPISLDATASGMQLLSVLCGDRKAAKLTNVIDSGTRMDAYTALFEAMKTRVEDSKKISRSKLKDAIMTAFYGSTAVPKRVFGTGKLLGSFFETLEAEAPYIWELNKAFLDMWDPTALSYDWILPDNFHVHAKVMGLVQEDVRFCGQMTPTFRRQNMPSDTGRSIGANITHSVDGLVVRELMRRCTFDPAQKEEVQQLINAGASGKNPSGKTRMVQRLWGLYEQSGYLSARVLDCLDDTNIGFVDTDPLQDLLDSMPEKPFKIIAVHDCFRVHPNYGNDLRKQYNLQLSLIAQSQMLQFLLTQLLRKEVPINKPGSFYEEILDANYALS